MSDGAEGRSAIALVATFVAIALVVACIGLIAFGLAATAPPA